MSDYEDDSEEGESAPSAFNRLKGWVREDQQHAGPWYREARKDFGFHAGGDQQWEQGDVQATDESKSVRTTFNFVLPSVSAVIGMEVSNRNEVTFIPRTTQTSQPQAGNPAAPAGGGGVLPLQGVPGADDQGPAETITAANKYTRDQCDAEDEESDAFQDTAICGMGWTETRVGYDENPQGDMIVDRCDPIEMGWDCHATKRNLVDARRIHRAREIDCRAALDMFSGYDLEDIDAKWARHGNDDENPHDADKEAAYRDDEGRTYSRKTVTVVEITWYNVKKTHRVANLNTGEVMDGVDDKTVKKLRERTKELGQKIAVQTVRTKEYRQAFLGSEGILGDDQMGDLCQSQKGFKFKCITGWRDRNKKQWFGIVRTMRDPQKWTNALYSSTLNSVMTSGKGIMAERSAFEKPEDADANWSSSSNIVWLREGALSGQRPKVMPKVPSALPAGIERLMEFALAAIRGVSGVNLETLGATDRDQAASLEYQRRQAATTILAPFFDGLRRYRKEQGRLAMDLIRNYLSDGRLIRVVGPDYEQYVPLIRDEDVTEYDIIVAESPSSPNQKEASWATISQILPVIGKTMGPRTMAALMKASPLPESVVKEFKQAGEQEQADMQNAPPPPDVMLTLAQVEKTKAETVLKQQEAAGKQIEVAANIEMTRMDMENQQFERQDKAAQRQHDMQMRGMEMQQTRQTHEMDMRAKQADSDNAASAEMTKAAGPALPAKFDALAKGLESLGKGIAEGMAALARSQAELAKAITAPRVTTVDDPMTGQKMTATSQLVN